MSDFNLLQRRLFGVSYQMLGTVAAAEDIAQECIADFLSKKPNPGIQNEEAYLVRSAINKSLNHLKKEQRSSYIGSWLPEPVLDESFRMESRLDLSFGFALLLDTLNPHERAVFILRESFDFPFSDIAQQFDLKEASARKLFQRAKAKLAEGKKTAFSATKTEQQKLITAFMQAAEQGKLDQLQRLLKEDMILWSDGGGKKAAALKPLYGRDICLKFILGLKQKAERQGQSLTYDLQIAGDEVFIFQFLNGVLDSIIFFGIKEGVVESIFIQRNPEKMK
jgi:RNA polymerase sigma-70 factor (ECF subfamily)